EQHAGEGGLPAAGLSDQPERLPTAQVQVDPGQCVHALPARGEGLGHPPKGDHWRGRRVWLWEPHVRRGRPGQRRRQLVVVAACPPGAAPLVHRRGFREAAFLREPAALGETQPTGTAPGEGRKPGMVSRRPWSLRWPRRGMQRRSPTVYGCRGCSNTSWARPSSTSSPAYITPTRSHILAITARLWLMNSTPV